MLFRSFDIRRADTGRVRLPSEVVRVYGDKLIVCSSLGGSFVFQPADIWEHRFVALYAAFGGHLDPRKRDIIRWLSGHSFGIDVGERGRVSLSDTRQLGQYLSLLCVGNRAHLMATHTWHELRNDIALSGGAAPCNKMLSDPFSRLSGIYDIATTADDIEKIIFDNPKLIAQNCGRELEYAVANILGNADVGVVELTRGSGDSGTDLVVHVPRGGFSEILYVQCKSSHRRVTVRELRELIGTVARDGVSGGLLVATQGFTQHARDEAAISRIRVDLVDACRLVDWVETNMCMLAVQASLVTSAYRPSHLDDASNLGS